MGYTYFGPRGKSRTRQLILSYCLLVLKCVNLGNELGEPDVDLDIGADLGIDPVVGDGSGLKCDFDF